MAPAEDDGSPLERLGEHLLDLGATFEAATPPVVEGESQTWRVAGTESEQRARIRDLDPETRRAVRGWAMYDWANSAFSTSVVVAILPVYFGILFIASEGTDGWKGLPGETLWSWTVSLATALVAVTSPALGVIADRTRLKMTLLKVCAGGGALATLLLGVAFVLPGAEWMGLLAFFLLANIGFAGGNVFYNSLLPGLVPQRYYDSVSSRGFAYGYIGGGLLLAVHLALLMATGNATWVVRMSLASVGVWWFGWALWTFATVKEPQVGEKVEGLTPVTATKLAFRELAQTGRQVKDRRHMFSYLVSYLLFNDAIQTVLIVAGVYAAISLGVGFIFLLVTILILQFVGAPGALAFEWLAGRWSTKRALMAALIVWMFVLLFAISAAALVPDEAAEHDYEIVWDSDRYRVERGPSLGDTGEDADWKAEVGDWDEDANLTGTELQHLLDEAAPSRFSVWVENGSLNGSVVGEAHPSSLDGPLDVLPRTMRDIIWQPLGLHSGYQFLLIGVFVGFVMGGSQALARSQFAVLVPAHKAGEFFGFFGFMNKAASVIGPFLFGAIAAFDQRMGIFGVLLLMVVGTLAYSRVNVVQGEADARAEEARVVGADGGE